MVRKNMNVAIIHDWLTTYAGAERVLEQLLTIFPNADIYTIVDFLSDEQRVFLHNKKPHTSFVQNLPCAKGNYRQYLPLMPLAVEQFDLSSYNLVISSSHAVAKGVITGPDQIHISYVHSPIRYAWDLQHQYLKEAGLATGIKGWMAKVILHYIRQWDMRTANGVDAFIANSGFIQSRIWKVYRRDARVIYPPVDIDMFSFQEKKSDFYVTASRMVPYKKIDLIVEAFSAMPDKTLIVIGDGPDYNKIKTKAAKNVKLLGYQPAHILREYMQEAKAFIFAAEEDFGITPVEAQACGTPVIAFGKGGVLETVRGLDAEHPTGVFYYQQTVSALVDAVNLFESTLITPEACRENSLRFSPERFRNELKEFVDTILQKKTGKFGG